MKEIRDINFEHPAVGTVTISNFRKLVSTGQIGCFMRRDMLKSLCFHLVRDCSEDSMRVIANVWSIEIMNQWSTIGESWFHQYEWDDPEDLRQQLIGRLNSNFGWCTVWHDFVNLNEPWRILDEVAWLFMILTGTAVAYARARKKDDLIKSKCSGSMQEMVQFIAFPEHPDFSDGWVSCNNSFIFHDWPAFPEVKDEKIFEAKIAEADQRAEIGAL